jgi:hypothetical protein
MAAETPFLRGNTLRRFEAVQHQLVPSTARFEPAQRAASLALVNELTSQMPAENRRKLAVFLLAIDVVSCAVGRRRFARLPAEKQQRVLQWFFDCPVPLLRKGFWGLNALAKLSAYGQSERYDQIGYRLRANPDD